MDEISTQALVDTLRARRTDLDNIRELLLLLSNETLQFYTCKRSYKAAQTKIDETRFQLGYVLEKIGSSDPYQQVDNQYDARGETPEPKTESDQGDLTRGDLDLSEEEALLEIRDQAKSIYREVEEIHQKVRIQDPLFYQHLEQAVMHCRELRSHAGVIYSAIR